MSASAATPVAPAPAPAPAPAQLLFRCQACASVLDITGEPEAERDLSAEHDADAPRADPSRGGPKTGGGVSGAAAMDESFVNLRSPGVAPGADAPRAAHPPPPRGVADSFVVLRSSVSRVPAAAAAAGAGLDARFAALARLFDMASDETKVDHPVCLECAAALRAELDARARDAEDERETYERSLETLRASRRAESSSSAGGEGLDLEAEALKAEAEADEAEAEAEALEAELATLRLERLALERSSRDLDAREDRYWNDFNDFKSRVGRHVDERDALVTGIEQTGRQLERLRRVNVFNDAFHIWFDGPFGTVNGFRLGRLPDVPVEWDEINAAWGMACLLLHTMATAAKMPPFRSFALKPLGSFSKLVDRKSKAEYELYGPVNILSSHKYDRAMFGFLQCLREFAEFASEVDRELGAEPRFELPYHIEGDTIDGRKIGFPFNRYERWTAALKITLADLKACLAWLSNQQQRSDRERHEEAEEEGAAGGGGWRA